MRGFRALRPYLVVGLLNASEGMITMLTPPYLDSLGFAPAAIGLLVSAYAVASLVSRLPAGALYQQHGARRLLLGALLIVAGVSLLYPFARDAIPLLLVRAVHGLAYGLATTVNLALFIDRLPPGANRYHIMGYFTAALSFGFTVGQGIAGFAAEWYGYGFAFALAAIPPLLALADLDGGRSVSGAPVPASVAPSLAARPGATPSPGPRGARAVVAALQDPGLLSVALLGFFLTFYLNLASTFMPLLALSIGLGLAEIGIIRSAHSVFNSITRPFSGGFIQRVGIGRLATISLTLNAALLFALPWATNMLALAGVMLLIGLIRGVAMVANSISVAADIDTTRVSRGLASGIFYAARDIGAIIGPVVGGAVAGAVGLETMFRVVSPVALALYLGGVTLAARRAAVPVAASTAGPVARGP